ncbi:MAG: hypothetical protein EBX41_06120 [Chitinophagia bacterium]|nr:hypothetical protein [Chitinophagia bacterium]
MFLKRVQKSIFFGHVFYTWVNFVNVPKTCTKIYLFWTRFLHVGKFWARLKNVYKNPNFLDIFFTHG